MVGMLESTAKKMRILKSGKNVMMPVPDLDRAKINAHSLESARRHLGGVQQWPIQVGDMIHFNYSLNKISKISIS